MNTYLPNDILKIINEYAYEPIVYHGIHKGELLYFDEFNDFGRRVYVNRIMMTCTCNMYFYYRYPCNHIMGLLFGQK